MPSETDRFLRSMRHLGLIVLIWHFRRAILIFLAVATVIYVIGNIIVAMLVVTGVWDPSFLRPTNYEIQHAAEAAVKRRDPKVDNCTALWTKDDSTPATAELRAENHNYTYRTYLYAENDQDGIEILVVDITFHHPYPVDKESRAIWYSKHRQSNDPFEAGDLQIPGLLTLSAVKKIPVVTEAKTVPDGEGRPPITEQLGYRTTDGRLVDSLHELLDSQ